MQARWLLTVGIASSFDLTGNFATIMRQSPSVRALPHFPFLPTLYPTSTSSSSRKQYKRNCFMLSRFRQAIFGLPLLSQAPRHASYTGPTTPTASALAQSQEASKMASQNKVEIATLASGCFWGLEHLFRKQLKDKLIDAHVGYTVSIHLTTDMSCSCCV